MNLSRKVLTPASHPSREPERRLSDTDVDALQPGDVVTLRVRVMPGRDRLRSATDRLSRYLKRIGRECGLECRVMSPAATDSTYHTKG